MFAKKTRIISLLLAVVLLLCPLQAASAETQKTPEEKIGKQLFDIMKRIPDGKFGVLVAFIDYDKIKSQAEKAWEKELEKDGEGFADEHDDFCYLFMKDTYKKMQSDFMDKIGLTEQDRIVKLWWAEGVLVMLNKEQIYHLAEMDEVQYFDFYWLDPIQTRVVNFTCEDALEILQIAVGTRGEVLGHVSDVNLDGTTDVVDALWALQSAVGLKTVSWPFPLPFGMENIE